MNTLRNQEPSADPFERYSIQNTTKLTLYLADRDRNGNLYPIEKYKIVFNRFVKFLSQSFGGCTLISSEGGYMNEKEEIIYENTKLLYSYCDYDLLIDKKSELVSLLEEYLIFTDQESALFTINDKPYYIYNPNVINLDLEDEKILQKEQQEEQQLVIEANNFNDFKNKFKDIIDNQEKQIETDLTFKTFYNYNNMISYIDSHLIYSTYPILQHGGDDMKYTEGNNIELGDLIFIFDKYSSYSYDCIYKVIDITKCFIKYKRVIYNPILDYHNTQDWGQSKQAYKYNYNICESQIYRKKINDMYLKLNDLFKNSDFLYITQYRH
jgi:hypothetical protein